MDIRPIRTEKDYERAVEEIADLMERQPPKGTEEYDRLDVLATLVDAYEREIYEDELDVEPRKVVQFHMDRLGWTQTELARRANLNQSHLSSVLNGRRSLSLSQMKKLSLVFDIPIDRLVDESDVTLGA